jgi:glycosyltransferase involved in cell wall biosynthesis
MDGIADYCFFLVESMSETCSYCRIHVIAPIMSNNKKGIGYNADIQLFRVWDFSSPLKSLASILRIIQIVLAKELDILHIQYRFTHEQGGSVGEPFLVLILILRTLVKKTKIVVSLHDFWSPSQIENRMRELSRSRTIAKFYKLYYVVYVRLMLSLPHAIFSITIGKGSRNSELIRKYAKSEVTEVLHGLPKTIQVDRKTQNKHKESLGVKGRFVILLFGFIRSDKGYEYVFRALRKIIELTPTVKDRIYVFVVGAPLFSEDEAYLNYLEELVEELDLGDITRIVPRHVDNEEISIYYGAADITVLSNTQRVGPSGVFFFSLAYEVPTIITSDNVFVTSKSLIPALIVNLNVDELAWSIASLMNQPSVYAEQVQKIRKYKMDHTNQGIVLAHLNVYRKLLEK